MIPILYAATETAFTTNGVGRLSDATTCYVEEERNGIYELTLQYPITGAHFEDLAPGMIIGAIHDDKHDIQPFDIYKVTKPIDGIVTVNAQHISYRLSKHTLMPMTADSCAAAFLAIPNNIIPSTCPFSFWTDKSVVATFATTEPQTVRSMLGGTQGSILDVYGKADYEWDKWTVKLHAHRGTRTGQVIRYGKNLADIKHTLDSGNSYNGAAPYWKSKDTGEVVMLSERYILAGSYEEGDPLRIIPMDLSEAFEEPPTEAQLRTKAQARLDGSDALKPSENITIDFVQLWQTEEYKDVAALQRLSLCDEVDVYHKAIGVLSKNIQIIKVKYDVLLERYEKMELGEPKTNMGDTIKQATTTELLKVVPTKSVLEGAISHATDLISGGLGGNVVINSDAEGHPNEILIMDTTDKETAVNVLRINMGGIGFSTSGYNGPFQSAWTIDGHFVADYIDTGTLTANLIKAGILSDLEGKTIWNLETGEFRNEMGQYIRIGDGEVILGEAGNPFTLAISNTRISFRNGSAEVAYISDNKLYIENVEITKTAVISGLKYYRENGHIYIEPEVV